jgi:ABC-type phosphonate transport system ATPase subunit
MVPSVHVKGLNKNYGRFHAVKGVDFEIFPGEVFGLLGPNGAGKTTTAATWNAAKLLRAETRIGLVQPGYDASLLVVDGDPTRDVSATERISSVIFKGERVRRVELFDASKNPLE